MDSHEIRLAAAHSLLWLHNMKQWLCVLVAMLAWVPGMTAQVSVELLLDQEQFLPQESLPMGVRIVNQSGKTLSFGTNTEWLRFSVEYSGGGNIGQYAPLNQSDPFTLPTAKRATRVVDLAASYELTKPGRYKVTVTADIPGWDQVLTSTAKTFQIVNGSRIWDQEFGLPSSDSANNQVTARKYVLEKMITMKESRLYVRLTNLQESECYRVYQLCPMVSFAQPETQIDKDSNLHVLCQTGAKIFKYFVINPNCEVAKRLSYEYTGSRPTLTRDGDGGFRIAGGRPKASKDDVGVAPEMPVVKIVTPPDTDSAPESKKKKKAKKEEEK